MPSAAQKRVCANGRSAEISMTTVLFSAEPLLLKARTDMAQVGVSMLGKMLSTLRSPAKVPSAVSARALSASLKSGAVRPFCGRLPPRVTGLPFRVTVLVILSILDNLGVKYISLNKWQLQKQKNALNHEAKLYNRILIEQFTSSNWHGRRSCQVLS